MPELFEALNRTVNREFKAFCKLEIVLKGQNPDELVAFSNKSCSQKRSKCTCHFGMHAFVDHAAKRLIVARTP